MNIESATRRVQAAIQAKGGKCHVTGQTCTKYLDCSCVQAGKRLIEAKAVRTLAKQRKGR